VARNLGMTPEKRVQIFDLEHIVFSVRRDCLGV
jgi:hypothetical protein